MYKKLILRFAREGYYPQFLFQLHLSATLDCSVLDLDLILYCTWVCGPLLKILLFRLDLKDKVALF